MGKKIDLNKIVKEIAPKLMSDIEALISYQKELDRIDKMKQKSNTAFLHVSLCKAEQAITKHLEERIETIKRKIAGYIWNVIYTQVLKEYKSYWESKE